MFSADTRSPNLKSLNKFASIELKSCEGIDFHTHQTRRQNREEKTRTRSMNQSDECLSIEQQTERLIIQRYLNRERRNFTSSRTDRGSDRGKASPREREVDSMKVSVGTMTKPNTQAKESSIDSARNIVYAALGVCRCSALRLLWSDVSFGSASCGNQYENRSKTKAEPILLCCYSCVWTRKKKMFLSTTRASHTSARIRFYCSSPILIECKFSAWTDVKRHVTRTDTLFWAQPISTLSRLLLTETWRASALIIWKAFAQVQRLRGNSFCQYRLRRTLAIRRWALGSQRTLRHHNLRRTIQKHNHFNWYQIMFIHLWTEYNFNWCWCWTRELGFGIWFASRKSQRNENKLKLMNRFRILYSDCHNKCGSGLGAERKYKWELFLWFSFILQQFCVCIYRYYYWHEHIRLDQLTLHKFNMNIYLSIKRFRYTL